MATTMSCLRIGQMAVCPTEDTLELYAANRLTDYELLADVEEHLLLCEYCRRAVVDCESECQTIKEACQIFQRLERENDRAPRSRGAALLIGG